MLLGRTLTDVPETGVTSSHLSLAFHCWGLGSESCGAKWGERRMLRVLSELRRPEQPLCVLNVHCVMYVGIILRNILLLDWNICIVCILIIFYISPYTGDYS